MMRNRKLVRGFAVVLLVAVTLFVLQRVLMPKYVVGVVEGALIGEYYQDEKNHDVVFIGDCEVYENFTPAVLWQEYGINSYIRGSAQQLIWQSYYLLEDTLRYEKPQVVIFNVLSMKYNEPQKEAYNRMTLEGMRWSISKVKDIQASMMPEEHFVEYVFPILRYHARWNELTMDDLRYAFHTPRISHNGYYMRVDVKPAENVPEGKVLADYSFGENAWNYLEKMTQLCKENDIQLILIKAPSLYPYWYPEWEEQIEDYAAENELPYLNFLENAEKIGIDYTTDTYDAGLHLNLSGAEKVTRVLGQYLAQECQVPDRRDEEKLVESWEKKLEFYEADRRSQLTQQEIKIEK